jgi:hypothetical protein
MVGHVQKISLMMRKNVTIDSEPVFLHNAVTNHHIDTTVILLSELPFQSTIARHFTRCNASHGPTETRGYTFVTHDVNNFSDNNIDVGAGSRNFDTTCLRSWEACTVLVGI